MAKKILFLIFFSSLFLTLPQTVFAGEVAGASALLRTNVPTKQVDVRAFQLQKFLESYSSPLAPYAGNLVKAADNYGIDWRLVTAITGIESSFGRFIPYNSYNAYGWRNGDYSFKSWEDSIEVVSKTLGEKYVAKGLDTPYKIGPVYAPPSSTWAAKVDHYMKQIESFEAETVFQYSFSL